MSTHALRGNGWIVVVDDGYELVPREEHIPGYGYVPDWLGRLDSMQVNPPDASCSLTLYKPDGTWDRIIEFRLPVEDLARIWQATDGATQRAVVCKLQREADARGESRVSGVRLDTGSITYSPTG